MKRLFKKGAIAGKKGMFALVLVIMLSISAVLVPVNQVEAAHKHRYSTVVKCSKSGWLKHTKTLKCSCGAKKTVTESCSGLKQVGGIKGYYFIFLPGTSGKDHSHNMKCSVCKGVSNLGCSKTSCK